MSRIYEALQRAEAERQIEREDSSGAVLTGSLEADLVPPPPPPRVPPVTVSAPRSAVERMDTPEPQPFIPPAPCPIVSRPL